MKRRIEIVFGVIGLIGLLTYLIVWDPKGLIVFSIVCFATLFSYLHRIHDRFDPDASYSRDLFTLAGRARDWVMRR